MSLANLCFVTMLATVVAFPTLRESEIEMRQSEARTANSPKIEMPPAAVLPVQSRNSSSLGPGRVLVASRQLGDPNFAEAVILLVHYDTDGVIGLILNRRTKIPVSRVLAQVKAAKNRSDPVYLGGPVETSAVFALLQSSHNLDKANRVFGSVYWISAKTALEKAISSRPDPSVFHVYLGYAGWTTDQLSNEVRLGGWFIFQADQHTVFNANPDALWREMIKKTELNMAGYPCGAPSNANRVSLPIGPSSSWSQIPIVRSQFEFSKR